MKESINGFGTTADGRTQTIAGSMVATGTTITEGQFTVDMTTFTSDESRRDQQLNGRVMDVSKYPTSTFVLTAPIDFGAIPSPSLPRTTVCWSSCWCSNATRP